MPSGTSITTPPGGFASGASPSITCRWDSRRASPTTDSSQNCPSTTAPASSGTTSDAAPRPEGRCATGRSTCSSWAVKLRGGRRSSLAAPALADHRSYIHIFEAGRPIRVGKTTYMDTSTVIGLSQRSKVLLNVHHGVNVYFEWQRIVLQGIWQRTLVVSERCSVAPPFRAGVHYVEADLDQIPRVLRYYLNDPQGRGEAQEIADAGYETLVSECRLSRFLEVLLLRHAASGAVLDHFDSGRLAMAVPEPRRMRRDVFIPVGAEP